VPGHLPRRRLLIASATALPLLLATAGCRSADLFAGPDPLGGRPPLAHGTVALEAAITAEAGLISRYQSVISGGGLDAGESSLIATLLAQHQDHLVRLRGRLVVPAGASASVAAQSPGTATATATATPTPAAPARIQHPIGTLRDAERQSADSLVRQLTGVEPALAQLFASIAASDATHAAALSALGTS